MRDGWHFGPFPDADGRVGPAQRPESLPPPPRHRHSPHPRLPTALLDELRGYAMRLHTREQAREGQASAPKEQKPVS